MVHLKRLRGASGYLISRPRLVPEGARVGDRVLATMRTPTTSWLIWCGAVLLSLIVAAGAALDWQHVGRQLAFARQLQDPMHAPAIGSADTGTEPPFDFTTKLPAQSPSAAQVVALLQRHCKRSGASLVEFNSIEHRANATSLGWREADVEILGGYAAVKRTLAAVLESSESSSLRSLRLRAEPESSTVRARATLVFWSAAAARPDPSATIAPRDAARAESR